MVRIDEINAMETKYINAESIREQEEMLNANKSMLDDCEGVITCYFSFKKEDEISPKIFEESIDANVLSENAKAIFEILSKDSIGLLKSYIGHRGELKSINVRKIVDGGYIVRYHI